MWRVGAAVGPQRRAQRGRRHDAVTGCAGPRHPRQGRRQRLTPSAPTRSPVPTSSPSPSATSSTVLLLLQASHPSYPSCRSQLHTHAPLFFARNSGREYFSWRSCVGVFATLLQQTLFLFLG
ncbi:hypothetical protein BDA96_02G118800 [Sorghum bicolor]|uniref:Uncharacterized protein n=2 Tax=Sorghum bicolor TaxID=4558 RepID=A0A921USD0_SORBI|nr:hypothetical protein BDA96_02G118800 [Sorghum bicolor]OQU88880.1 hypothetical protein SORBI_3002G113066 [Sorghum bicolor]